jgi:hypothetical protein
LTFCACRVTLGGHWLPTGGGRASIGRWFGFDPPGIEGLALSRGMLGKGEGRDRMTRGCFCMSPSGTGVTGVAVLPVRVVCRCVSTAEASLSLSLSLCSQFPSAQSGAKNHRLAGKNRVFGRGFCRSRIVRDLFERRRRVPLLAVTFEEASSRVPSRGGVGSAGRRGPLHAGSRRSFLLAGTLAGGC